MNVREMELGKKETETSQEDLSPPDGASGHNALDPRLLALLVCPVTRGTLIYDPERQELISKSANLAYPIRNGIPVMLPEEARPLL